MHRDGQLVAHLRIGRDLLAIISRLVDRGVAEQFGVTGSFLVGCAREHSDIDLVCYGPVGVERHVNCEPLRADADRCFATVAAEQIGEIGLLATITDDREGRTTPAQYRIEVRRILRSSVDERAAPAARITYVRSYLGTHTGAFSAGDEVVASGPLLHLQHVDDDDGADAFGIDVTPWDAGSTALVDLDQGR